jgi:hypothetical protein
MVAKLGENERPMRMDRFSKMTVVSGHLRMIGLNDAFPGPVIGMDGQFAQYDEPATSLCAPCEVGRVPIRESPLFAEVRPVSEKTDTIREDGLA